MLKLHTLWFVPVFFHLQNADFVPRAIGLVNTVDLPAFFGRTLYGPAKKVRYSKQLSIE